MKKYNVPNYIRYKKELDVALKLIPEKDFKDYSRKELIIVFMPLVENIARKFSTTEQAAGILNINDFIQEGHLGLIAAIDRIDWEELAKSKHEELTLKSFLGKRIKGAVRRAIDINRGNMRRPEHKLNEIRKNSGKDRLIVETFFNQIFLSIDDNLNINSENAMFQIPDKSEPYNIGLLNKYLLSIMREHLTEKEYEVIRLSYGLDCDKMSAIEIANKLQINGTANYVRVSQMKKEAIEKLVDNVSPEQVIDYL